MSEQGIRFGKDVFNNLTIKVSYNLSVAKEKPPATCKFATSDVPSLARGYVFFAFFFSLTGRGGEFLG